MLFAILDVTHSQKSQKGSSVKDREQQQKLATIKFRAIFNFYHVDGHLGSQPLLEITNMGAIALLLIDYATNFGQASSLTCLGHVSNINFKKKMFGPSCYCYWISSFTINFSPPDDIE